MSTTNLTNGHILELARQAFQSVNELAPEGVADYTVIDQAWFKLHNQRFAELIVKECLSMCDETQADYLKHRKATTDFDEKNIFAEGEAAIDVIKYKMKKHFGIKL